MKRKGTLYWERTSHGTGKKRKKRWVAEIYILTKRFRFRSPNRNNAAEWLRDMVKNQGTIEESIRKTKTLTSDFLKMSST